MRKPLPTMMAGEIESAGIGTVKLDKIRALIKGYINRHQYESAMFWAEKVVSLSKGDIQDKYWYAQTLFLTGQYIRAANLLKSAELDKKSIGGRYLAAKCHYECREYPEALEILDQSEESVVGGKPLSCNKQGEAFDDIIPAKNMESAINLLRGRVYEAQENRNLAAECFREALRADVYCYEAFDALVNHHMMTAQEERELLESLPFAKQCSPEEIELVSYLYETKLKKYNKPGDLDLPSSLERLSDNLSVLVGMAERHYYNCDFRKCIKITERILKSDPYNSDALPLHVAVLVELQETNKLFYLAHKLVEMYPAKAIAWFSVGCYYLLVGKQEPARRYLSKACTIDRVYGPAWLAFGHSFAADNEHDQAMAAYFTAAQLMKGCHLPVLYIGLEYGLTNNAKLAERFFSQALSIAPEDPFVLHEMGVIAFQNQDYKVAESHFKMALEKIQEVNQDVLTDQWEPLLNNMGHVCRKLKKFDEALEYYRHSLIICPQNPSTLSSLGYVFALTGDFSQAVDYFHKALGLRRDDTFSTTMLGYVIEQLMGEMTACDGVPDVLPVYTCEGKLDTSEVKITEIPTDSSTCLEADSTLGDASMGDSSCMMIDTDMEDV